MRIGEKTRSWILNIVMFGSTAALALVLGSQLPTLLKKIGNATKNGDYSAHVAKLPNTLTLYGTSTCPHCVKAREYLRRAGISFNDLNIDQSKAAEQAYLQLGQNVVPILVSAKSFVVGFDERAYADLSESVRASSEKLVKEK